ncbi:MAG: DUF1415 family protein [Methylophaga sp.]|nr:DUF1415 family protein [Methylophaga sp.]
MNNNESQINQVKRWLDDVVIGLNLCPFAAKPRRNKQVRFTLSNATTSEILLTDLHTELTFLERTPSSKVETTLVIVPNMLTDFDDYNQFLDVVDELLAEFQWEGIFQVASFHPDYCFADTETNSVENLTNRSPYPILHLIREQSMEKALENMTEPDEIFKRNIQTMNNLSTDELKALFPYLYS